MFANAREVFAVHKVTVISTTEDENEDITKYVVEVKNAGQAMEIGADFSSKDDSGDVYDGWY